MPAMSSTAPCLTNEHVLHVTTKETTTISYICISLRHEGATTDIIYTGMKDRYEKPSQLTLAKASAEPTTRMKEEHKAARKPNHEGVRVTTGGAKKRDCIKT